MATRIMLYQHMTQGTPSHKPLTKYSTNNNLAYQSHKDTVCQAQIYYPNSPNG